MMELEPRRARLRGLDTSWLEAGPKDAPIMLLLHGFPDSPYAWEHQLDHFSKRFHVVAPFARGAGESARGDRVARYGSDATSLDLLELLSVVDPSGERGVYCVGHDLGAVHAWHLAPLLGRRLQALVVLNGLSLSAMLGRMRSFKQHRRSWYIYGMQLPWIPEAIMRYFPSAFLNLAYGIGKLPASQRPFPEHVEGCLEAPLNQYRAFLRDTKKVRARALARIEAPVLVIWGKEDPFLLTPRASEWEAAARDVTTRILPAGHWVHRERPAEVNRLMEKFFGGRA